MYLHEERESFAEVLAVTSDRYGISGEIIEKDYYVSMLLKALHEVETGFVFRGGTSLSKCYQIIERFSEDIDLSLIPKADHITEGMKPLPKAAGSGPWRGVSTICWAGRISLPSMRSIVMSCGIIMKARGCGCMF